MTLPAALSITSASVGLLAALLALGMSSAPGWRELRWFALCAALAAIFNLANAPVTLASSSAHFVVLCARVQLLFGGLHAATWFKYVAVHERRALTRFEKAAIAGGVILSVLSLVPNLVLSEETVPRNIPWLGVTYRDPPPTDFGNIAIAYYLANIGFLFVRSTRQWLRGDDKSRAQALALGAVFLGALHDGLASSDVIRSPYLLDLSLLALVLIVGGSITSSFVSSARALEASSRQLEAAQSELVAKERLAALGELSAVVAHEVRNPLAVVFNALANLRRAQPGSAEHTALVAIIQEEAERLRDIVSDLLEFARPRPPILSPALLDEVVRGAVDAATNGASKTESDVVVEVTAPTELECDERLVRQAVVNLVTNALHASGRRGPVHVSVTPRERDALVVRVADDGDGVPDDLRERVFTPFFSTRPSGTGLGLAVVQRCAEAHGGRALLAPKNGRGAVFELELPRHASNGRGSVAP